MQVEMSPYRRQGLFRHGKMALNLYENLVKFYPGMPWPTDKAYVYRPAT